MQLNEAVSRRLVELMQERGMTQYQLYPPQLEMMVREKESLYVWSAL